MTTVFDVSAAVSTLKELGDVVWISAETSALTTEAPWKAKTGWLRFIDRPEEPNLIAADRLPEMSDRKLMSGEWVDGNITSFAELTKNGIAIRMITEHADKVDGAIPVIRRDSMTLLRPLSKPSDHYEKMIIAAYFGFANSGDADDGKLRKIAERFVGFDCNEAAGN